MKNNAKSRWLALNALLIVFLVLLFGETKLPVSRDLDPWLDGLFVVLFYGGLALWILGERGPGETDDHRADPNVQNGPHAKQLPEKDWK